MRTSASSRAPEPPARIAAGGFSLLELLIVLALLAMVTAMVAPRLARTYDAVVGSGERDEVDRQLERLPRIARLGGQAIEVGAGDAEGLAARLDLPEGWVVEPLETLRIEANGICLGAPLEVSGRGRSERVRLLAPACGVARGP